LCSRNQGIHTWAPMSPPLVVVFRKIHPKCTSQIGHSRVCGSMIAITMKVQIASTTQPVVRSQRAPRSPLSSTESSSSESHGVARSYAERTKAPNRPLLPTDAKSSEATPSSIRVSVTLDSMPGLESRLASLPHERRQRSSRTGSSNSAQFGTLANSRTSPSVITPVSSCQLLASHRAQRWNTTSRPAIRIRIVMSAPFAHRVQACIGGLPALVTRCLSARGTEN